MKREMIPTWEELERHRQLVPEINPAAVIAMLGVKQAGEEVQASILDVLQHDYQMSEGKFCTLIVLHQHPEGVTPSTLADHVGVTRATVSTMLQRLAREGLVETAPSGTDKRAKVVRLTQQGREFMNRILPAHYLRVTKLMERLDPDEQRELIRLLNKLTGGSVDIEKGNRE